MMRIGETPATSAATTNSREARLSATDRTTLMNNGRVAAERYDDDGEVTRTEHRAPSSRPRMIAGNANKTSATRATTAIKLAGARIGGDENDDGARRRRRTSRLRRRRSVNDRMPPTTRGK